METTPIPPPIATPASTPASTPISTLAEGALQALLAPYDLRVERLAVTADIPGSFWGAPEAGLVRSTLYVRPDTPVHSALHESCHFICMDTHRRTRLHTDAGGDDTEECAVCYLQILLADQLAGFDRERMMADMDAWGYSFRLGSAQAWFESDANGAYRWLDAHALLPAGTAMPQLG